MNTLGLRARYSRLVLYQFLLDPILVRRNRPSGMVRVVRNITVWIPFCSSERFETGSADCD